MKNQSPRRRFFKTFLRGSIAGGLAMGGIALASRRNPVSEDSCSEKFICPRCGKNASCGLPHAQNYRNHRARMSKNSEEVPS